MVRPAEAVEKPTTPTAYREVLLKCLGGPWPEPCDLRPKFREARRNPGSLCNTGKVATSPPQ